MSPSPTDPEHKPQRTNPWALAFGAGAELTVSVLLCVFAGKWADNKFGTQPWLLLLSIFAGITLGLYQLIKKMRVPNRSREKRP